MVHRRVSRSEHPLASLNFEDGGNKLLEKFSSYLPVHVLLTFPNSWTLRLDHFVLGISCKLSVACTQRFITHTKKAFGFTFRQRFQNCVLTHTSLWKEREDTILLKESFRMTVQLDVFKPCSGVRMHRWIASKLYICAGVGVGVERETERIIRLV